MEFDRRKLKMRPVAERVPLVTWAAPDTDVRQHMPAQTCRSLRKVAAAMVGGPCLVGMGAHLVKLRLGPLLGDLIRRHQVTYLAMNGAAAIHDMELACFGQTSEDVVRGLSKGCFGMWDEPGSLFAAAVERADEFGGLGAALSEVVTGSTPARRRDASLLASCHYAGRAPTVHVTIGADYTHLHPRLDGALLGRAAMQDFETFCGRVASLEGGCYVNLGSAVVMPEVFLKAVSAATNLGADLSRMTTANLDMLDHYRPRRNVVERPPGEGIDVRGRLEVLLPALHRAALKLR